MAPRPEQPTTWLVEYHSAAVAEFDELRDRRQRKGVLTIVGVLRQIGPKLTEPHMKRVKGTDKLCELRPGGGTTPVRPLYFRFDERTFKVLAIAPEAVVDAAGFRSAVARAVTRAKETYAVDV